MKISATLDANNYIIACNIGDGELTDGKEFDIDNVPDDFFENIGCYKVIDNELIYDEERQNSLARIDGLQSELSQLYEWFTYYDTQIAQYNRCIRLNEVFDADIAALDAQAAKNQIRIREIRSELQ